MYLLAVCICYLLAPKLDCHVVEFAGETERNLIVLVIDWQVDADIDKTEFTKKAGGFLSVMSRILRPILKSPEAGARTPIYLATAHEVARITGGYFVNCKQKRTATITYDRAIAAKHWEISEKLTSLNSGAIAMNVETS